MLTMSLPYDQPIADIARYVFHYHIDENDHAVWERARMALLDTLGCAIETAATSVECRKLLNAGLTETSSPNGFRLPGTNLQVDPVQGAFDFGALVRYLDHNDALGAAEWGHPSGKWIVRGSSPTRVDLKLQIILQLSLL